MTGPMLLPPLLAGLAVALLVAAGGAASRLADVVARAPDPVTQRVGVLTPRVVRGVCVLAGLVLWWVVDGRVGALLGMVTAGVGPRLLSRWDGPPDERRQLERDLPLALDLLAACLAGGATTSTAVAAVAGAVPGPCALRLSRVGAALAVGCTPAEAWHALGSGQGPAGAAARALARAADGGTAVADAVLRVAEDSRRRAGAQAVQRARRAGVLAVGPLGVCFLPAFLLVGVVPAVVGLAGPLFASL